MLQTQGRRELQCPGGMGYATSPSGQPEPALRDTVAGVSGTHVIPGF